MRESTPANLRHIFVSPRPRFPLRTAASLLGMSLSDLKREIENGSIVAVSTRLGPKVREEMIAAAMRRPSSRKRSGSSNSARASRVTNATCCTTSRGGMTRPSTRS